MPDLNLLNAQLWQGDPITAATAAATLTKQAEVVPEFVITVYDKMWTPIGAVGDYIECTGSDPRNNAGNAVLKLKGTDPYIDTFMSCKDTMVGITIETEGLRFAFYVDTFDYEFTQGEWTGTAHLVSIWDILNYLQIWPDWFLPIQAQILSHAIYIGPMCSALQVAVGEQAFRMQTGLWEFINTALSLDPDIRTWAGTLLTNAADFGYNILELLKCPIYVSYTNPFTDTSMLMCRTVRMESCASVIKDVVRATGLDVRVDLWLPGDPQPDQWTREFSFMALDRPTYVVTVIDRSQITGPTRTILDSVIKTVVDVEGSLLGNTLDPILNPQGNPAGLPEGFFIAPTLGVNWVAPWVLLVAPEPGDKGSVETCKFTFHTPKGFQIIIGGRSPQWLNDLFNEFFAWVVDAISILIGVTGIPSDLLAGFLNNSFLAFQLWQHFPRRSAVGPYHPAWEVFHSTTSAPYNVETIFDFINAFFDTRGWLCAQATCRNGEVYTLGKDVFRGALISIAYWGRKRLYTDFLENVSWRIDKDTRDLMLHIGDGKARESPLAKHQRSLTALFEAINVITLAPQSG